MQVGEVDLVFPSQEAGEKQEGKTGLLKSGMSGSPIEARELWGRAMTNVRKEVIPQAPAHAAIRDQIAALYEAVQHPVRAADVGAGMVVGQPSGLQRRTDNTSVGHAERRFRLM